MFCFFLTAKQYMKTPMKVSIRIQRIVGILSRMRCRISVTFKCIFYICNVYTYIQKISYFHAFLEKDRVPFSVQRKNIIFSRKKNNIFPDNTRKIIFNGICFLGRLTFRVIWREYNISMNFFWEKLSFIFRLKNKIIFWGKRNIIFPDSATRNIIFQCNIFGNAIFSEHLKKVSYFRVFFFFFFFFFFCEI